METGTGLSKYRWVILLVILPIIISTEMMWLSLAPISSMAEKYYNTSSLRYSYVFCKLHGNVYHFFVSGILDR